MTVVAESAFDALVRTACELSLDDVPDHLVAQAERIVADTIAVGTAGACGPEHAALVAARAVPAPAGNTNVLGAGAWAAPAPVAAFLNATAAIALELDEALVGGGHPAAHVVPAALAAAQERGCSGADLLGAVIAGYEVAGRLFRAHRMAYPAHPHGLIGAIGAAVAVARLADVDPVQAAHAAATIAPVAAWGACFEGATARNAWTGLGAMSAVLACDMADAGFTGARSAPRELLARVSGPIDEAPLRRPVAPGTLMISRSATRVYAVATPLHTAVEAARELRDKLQGPVTDILVESVEPVRKFVRPAEPNDLSARFSLPHAVAVALGDGPLDPGAFGYDADAAELGQRVRFMVAGDLQDRWPQRIAARVTVVAGGIRVTATCETPAGHPDRQLDAAAFERRLEELAGPGGPGLLRLRECADVSGFLEVLR